MKFDCLATSQNIARQTFFCLIQALNVFELFQKHLATNSAYLSLNVLRRGQIFKHYLTSKSQMFDKQCLIVWPGPKNKINAYQFSIRLDSNVKRVCLCRTNEFFSLFFCIVNPMLKTFFLDRERVDCCEFNDCQNRTTSTQHCALSTAC